MKQGNKSGGSHGNLKEETAMKRNKRNKVEAQTRKEEITMKHNKKGKIETQTPNKETAMKHSKKNKFETQKLKEEKTMKYNKKNVVELQACRKEKPMQISKYIGLDTHKDFIAVADAAGGPVRYHGRIENTPQALNKLVHTLKNDAGTLSFCYEAGPCGYEVYRQLSHTKGCACSVVAPSLIPRKCGDRVKTDRRDSESLARLLRAGELTPVWVPDQEQEAMRNLTRAREDMKRLQRQGRQFLSAFLLRYGKTYPGTCKWTQAHFRWLETVKFASSVDQIVFQEYLDAVKRQTDQVKALEKEMERTWPNWSLAPGVRAIMALRGCQLVAAMTVLAELGDLTRFDSPKQLMAYLGLVPREHSSGGKRRQGGITKTGNGHARRILVEAGWCYRFRARKTACIQRRAEQTSPRIQEIAWEAQKRLCGRYVHLRVRGKCTPVTVTAVARELAGFMWAVVCEQKREQERAKAA